MVTFSIHYNTDSFTFVLNTPVLPGSIQIGEFYYYYSGKDILRKLAPFDPRIKFVTCSFNPSMEESIFLLGIDLFSNLIIQMFCERYGYITRTKKL